MKRIFLILGIIIVAAGLFSILYVFACENNRCGPIDWGIDWYGTNRITNFEDCAAGGFPILESYPRQCRAGKRLFVETLPSVSSSVGLDQEIGGTPPPQELSSGIRGMVTVGPVCPVIHNPPDPACEDKPYAATLHVSNENGQLVKIVQANSQGQFEAYLEPGRYLITPAPQDSPFPTASPKLVIVTSNAFTVTNIVFDSGIR